VQHRPTRRVRSFRPRIAHPRREPCFADQLGPEIAVQQGEGEAAVPLVEAE